MDKTLQRIKAILKKEPFNILEEDVTLESFFVDDLGLDSMNLVELIMDCEKEFNITIPDEEAAKISQVKDLVKFIEDNPPKKD